MSPPRARRLPGPWPWTLLVLLAGTSLVGAFHFERQIRSDAVQRVAGLGEGIEHAVRARIDSDVDLLRLAASFAFRGEGPPGVAAGLAEELRRSESRAEILEVRVVPARGGDGNGSASPGAGSAVVDRARDSGRPVLAGAGDPSRPGTLLLAVPEYLHGAPADSLEERRLSYRGALVATLAGGKLLDAGTLAADAPASAELYAAREPVPTFLAWRGGGPAPEEASPDALSREFRVGGQEFLLRLTPRKTYRSLAEGLHAPMIAGLGLVLGLLAFSLAWSRELSREESRRLSAEGARVLSEALERNRALLASTPLGVIEWDEGFRVRALNAAAEGILGLANAEAAGRPGLEVLADPEEGARLWEAMARPEGGRASASARTAGGRVIRCDWSFSPLLDAEGRLTGVISLVEDLTARQEDEEAAREARKMEAIGRLAGGVAHDFNNLLTAIVGYVDLLDARLAGDEKGRGQLAEVRRAAARAEALTRQLLAFGRRQVLKVQRLDLNASVRQSSGLLARLLGETVRLELDLGRDLWAVQADPGQVEQVVVNLAVNARDAMPQGGVVTIRTANADVPFAMRRGDTTLPAGSWVLLEVSDVGEGMDESVLSRVFEPFFTTKARGKGTGLGLSTVYGIVRQSGGVVSARSVPGHGSAFEVYLPRTADAPSHTPSGGLPFLATEGSETVLLVEDEESLRALARQILVESGYTVLDAPDAAGAERVVESHAGPIHLLLTDVVLPQSSGPELARTLSEKRPDLRILFVSGYPDDALGRHGVLDETVAFLPKPFSPLALRQRVRQLLDAPAVPSPS